MTRETKYHLIAGVSTIVIISAIYVLLNYHFMPFSSVAPVKKENVEMNFPLEQMMEDLAEIVPLPDEKEKLNKEDIKESPKIKTKLTETASNDQENDAISEDDTVVKINPIKIEDIVSNDLVLDTAVLEELQKILKNEQIAQHVTQQYQKKPMSKSDRFQFYQKNYRAIRNFIIVYPYAIKTRQLIDSLNIQLAKTPSKAEQKRMINETEKVLFDQYESAIRKMTTTQGRILLKLIARETNKSGYQLIKEFKGGFSATFWYAVGKLFSTDLKAEYHKEKEDSIYEEIIYRYETGEFK